MDIIRCIPNDLSNLRCSIWELEDKLDIDEPFFFIRETLQRDIKRNIHEQIKTVIEWNSSSSF